MTEQQGHNDILEISLTYIQDQTLPPEVWATKLPYAIQFWTYHYTKASVADGILEAIFECHTTLQRWRIAYMALPSPFKKPLETSQEPLPLAAYFGLHDAVISIMAKQDTKALGQALVESARGARSRVFSHILNHYSCDSNPSRDEHLHEAIRAASSCGNHDIYRELVNYVAELQQKSMDTRISLPIEDQQTIPNDIIETNLTGDGSAAETTQIPFPCLQETICRASWLGLEDIVAKLLSMKVDPNPPQHNLFNGMTPLHLVVRTPHLATAKLLLDAGSQLESVTDDEEETPLCLAAVFGYDAMIQVLLEHGAAIDALDTSSWFPLQTACVYGNVRAVEVFLKFRNPRDYIPKNEHHLQLLLATSNNYIKIAEALLRYEDGLGQITSETDFPLHVAVKGNHMSIVHLLLKYGADINKRGDSGSISGQTPHVQIADADGWTPLWAAAKYNHQEILRILATAKADINSACTSDVLTPLHIGIEHPEVIQILLQHGADITITTNEGDTPLDLAIYKNEPGSVKAILYESPVKPSLTGESTRKALREAAYLSYTEVVALILEAGGDVNTVDSQNQSLLNLSMLQESDTLVRTILEYRPNLEIRDEENNEPLHFISNKTPVASVRLLVNAGMNLTAVNKKWETPLHCAIIADNVEVAKYLLSKKPVANSIDTSPFYRAPTPLQSACTKGSLEMIETLLLSELNINACNEGMDGSPIMMATLRQHDDLKEQIIQKLLDRGALQSSTPAGLFGYPIISASLNCPAHVIQWLIDKQMSIDVEDRLGRKAVHVACYNSLEVLNTLQVPDSDFAIRDKVGRVPLHYAVLSGQVDLVEEVLRRSEKVNITVNEMDEDGWTPLLWACRASHIWLWKTRRAPSHEDVITFLLQKGAKVNVLGRGTYGDWSALDIAHYHAATKYVKFMILAPSHFTGFQGTTTAKPLSSFILPRTFI
ncbi:Ankyrin-1 [Trichoderma lentiforme]|uniref:Ankyrin-1 n=1 Tax=Trichoderma lentiforme TaxID=1567552 RepID=A0A9P4XMH0_9HYPO|nr:Ankyrin-1 [Trichoderma lentiforme]